MAITLTQFETIDGLAGSLFRMGDFLECANPRAYIQTQNRLLDACADAMGWTYVDTFEGAEDCAAHVLADALTGVLDVVDVVD